MGKLKRKLKKGTRSLVKGRKGLSRAVDPFGIGYGEALFGEGARSSTETKEVYISPMTGEERGYLDMMGGIILPEYMKIAGYDLKQTDGSWKMSAREGTKEEIEQEQNVEKIEKQFQTNMMQFLSGDFALSEEQKKASESQFAPLKKAIEDAYGPEGISAKIMESDITKFSRELTKQTKEIAAASGRSPMDPEFQMQIQREVSQEVGRQRMALAEKEAEAKLGVEQQAANLRLSRFDPGKGSQALQSMRQSTQLREAIKEQQLKNIIGGYSMAETTAGKLQAERFARASQAATQTGSLMGTLVGIGKGVASVAGASGGGGEGA